MCDRSFWTQRSISLSLLPSKRRSTSSCAALCPLPLSLRSLLLRRLLLLLLLFRHRVPVNFSQQIAHRRRSSHERRRMMMWRRRAEKKASSLVSLLLLIFLLPLYPLLLILLWGVLLVVGRRGGPRGGEKHDAVDTSHKAKIINVDFFLFLFFVFWISSPSAKSTLFRFWSK